MTARSSSIKNTCWQQALASEFAMPHMQKLQATLKTMRSNGALIYPAEKDIFQAFEMTHLNDLKVVILGQDPYHGIDQAHGLSFSVPTSSKIPPSLKNIYKELVNDLQIAMPTSGYLGNWARQGVLLLNSVLTVEHGKPGSHKDLGWQIFTDRVIEIINQQSQKIIYLLWGAYAQSKLALIDQRKHIVLQAAHPSPFSAYRGFFGCQHFSKVNNILQENDQQPINWAVI